MEINFIILLYMFSLSATLFQFNMYVKKNISKMILVFSILIPSLFATFRMVGTDTPVYYSKFNSLNSKSLSDIFFTEGFKEAGNSLFIYIGNLVDSFNVYLFLYSFFTLFFIGLALKSLIREDLMGISFFLYLCIFYPASLNTMRQSLAVAIVFFSYKFILSKSFFQFFLWVVIAMQFHISSIVVLPVYWLINKEKKVNWSVFLSAFVIIIAAILNFQQIFYWISLIFNNERYIYYADYTESMNNRLFFLNLVIFIFLIVVYRITETKDNNTNYYFILLLVGLTMGITGFISPFIKRISIFFDIVQILLIPKIAILASSKNNKYLMLFFVYLFGVTYFIVFYVWLGFSGVIPYNIGIYSR
ncbi:EpsG family protein [Enterococcus faecium]|uniref:EpsG family protein n=2 Tax=Enterococcus faecium TaxID=1352 RepID=UPI001243A8CA|nr:EpsG family protein [Enterococcus faecium]KAA9167899.1 EpsG family protein [Enterococcus faecium]KAA9207345.1 EpsG family protein [Enterococcus faecium]MDW3707430.1 EpsG family protein [Enterococcus faecium]